MTNGYQHMKNFAAQPRQTY